MFSFIIDLKFKYNSVSHSYLAALSQHQGVRSFYSNFIVPGARLQFSTKISILRGGIYRTHKVDDLTVTDRQSVALCQGLGDEAWPQVQSEVREPDLSQVTKLDSFCMFWSPLLHYQMSSSYFPFKYPIKIDEVLSSDVIGG